MDYWQAALLGFLQGVTEFLPVSSSGHLRVGGYLFGLEEPQSFFDVGLHVGTLLAVIFFFWRDVLDLAAAPFRAVRTAAAGGGWKALTEDASLRGVWFIVLGSIPTGILGLYLGKRLEGYAASIEFVAYMFLVNSAILFSTRYVSLPFAGARLNRGFLGMRWLDALLVGAVQGLSVARGISRSGSTISTALLLGVDRETAGRFSFLLSIPAILGATVVSVESFQRPANLSWEVFLVGVGVALLSGVVSLKVLMGIVRRGRLHRFGWYTLCLGAALLVWYHFGQELSIYWEAAFHGR